MIYKGKRAGLDYITFSDVDRIHECLSRPEVYRFLASPWRLRTRERTRKRIEALLESTDRVGFKIVDLSTGENAGVVTLSRINYRVGRAEIGYRICPRHRGKGLATEGVKLMLKHAFEVLNLNLVYAQVKEPNVASQRVLIKNGFKLVGRIPQYTIVPGYGRVALLIFAITRDSFLSGA